MKRTMLNLFALTMILGGAAHLSAQEDNAKVCCSGGGATCCGSSCEADATGCSATP
jgi:hypothetical protein